MITASDALDVFVGAQRVGVLENFDDESQRFSFTESFRGKQTADRSVLGQIFEDRFPNSFHVGGPICWFAHLLPQGAMRQWQSKNFGVDQDDVFGLLLKVGDDLPGNVFLRTGERTVPRLTPQSLPDPPIILENEYRLKSSLAGAQWKLSANATKKGITINAVDAGVPCIAKFHATEYPSMPQCEFGTMRWARASGIRVPSTQLRTIDDFDELPDEIPTGDGKVFLIERFDRNVKSRIRIHMEDFGQILDRPPGPCQFQGSYEEIASVLRWISPNSKFDFLDQLVFMVGCGNGDGHLKNFSVLYEQPRRPVLSPCYDMVSTVAWGDKDLGLDLGGSRRWTGISLERFKPVISSLEIPMDDGMRRIRAMGQSLTEAWKQPSIQSAFTDQHRDKIELHLEKLEFLKEI